MMPNFLIIGTARAGTSSLYEYLRQHPEIYMCPNKEPMFFALENQRVNFRGPGDAQEINAKSVTMIDPYQALFEAAGDRPAIGEASALYLYSDVAAANIKRHIPNAKLIAMLRDPVERAYSSFLYMTREGREPLPEFEDALAAEEQRIEDNWEHIWHYRRMGFYYRQLRRYYDLFDPSQIKIILSEDLDNNPESVISELQRFLDVDATQLPDMSVKYNQGGVPRGQLLNRVLTRPSWIKQKLKPWLPRSVHSLYLRVKHANLERPEISAETRHSLREDYRNDIENLQDLIGRDLNAWLKPD